MTSSLATWLRWIAVVPAAIIAAGVAQYISMKTGWFVESAIHADLSNWLLKSIASLFMGISFVSAGAWMAPARRVRVAIGSTVLVLAWSSLLTFGGPSFWGPMMGGLGLLGAVSACLLVWRTDRSA